MTYDVSSWYIDQLALNLSAPVKKFYIGASDYSERVEKWPKIKRVANRIQSSKVTVKLANEDGQMNFFHNQLWTMPNTCSIQIGFTHATSGDELISYFAGEIKEITYGKNTCDIHIRDKLWTLTQKKIGDSADVVTFSHEIPSDIAWTVVTCYGELSSIESTSNPDIDYSSFLDWAEALSGDSVLMSAYYDGIKTSQAVESIVQMTDSGVWQEGNGKLYFKRYEAPSSLDFTIDQDEWMDLKIKIDGLRPINKAWVYGGYDVDSDYWAINVFDVSTTAVNTYGLHEDVFKDTTCWLVNSTSCQNLAQRIVRNYRYPPKKFLVDTIVKGLHRQIGETVRIVDSFYNLTSGFGWRYDEIEIDAHDFSVRYSMNEAIAGRAFFLDISYLDTTSEDLLL